MKKILTIALLLVATMAQAQTALQEIKEDRGRCGGVYYAYPVPAVAQTAAPKGYEPCYLSHYGRHGSRYLLSDFDYKRPLDMLRRADEIGGLTAKGKEVLARMEEIWKEGELHGDELSPLGKRQHRGIGERMFRSFPTLFNGKGRISARSTTSMRVALSMLSCVERLKELNPKLDIYWETSRANMGFLNSHTKRYDDLKRSRDGWQKTHSEFCARGIDATRFCGQLINDTAVYRKAQIFPPMLMNGLFDVAIDVQNMETDVDLLEFFTDEELYDLWRNGNSWFYHCDADSPYNEGTAMESCVPLLQNFVDEADKALAGKGDAVTLRFGHDGNIIPLCAIMRLKDCDASVSDMNTMDEHWRNYYVSPMGANVQLVFFRHKRSGDVIVKFLHNERETSIPSLPTDIAPYYHWADVRRFFLAQIEKHRAAAPTSSSPPATSAASMAAASTPIRYRGGSGSDKMKSKHIVYERRKESE